MSQGPDQETKADDIAADGTLPIAEDVVLAEGVDEDPVEFNRRLPEGKKFYFIATLATLYAAFHMANLNGLSISGMTQGIVDLPFLPSFPVETWNFRIIHVAGALALGFILFSGSSFSEDKQGGKSILHWLSLALLAPALFALGVALSFGVEISNGVMWNGIDAGIKFNETWLFGVPLLVATIGAIVLSWFHRTQRETFSAPDFVMAVCGFAVAAYLIIIFGTLMRNSTGTPFAPIGMSIAAIAGTLLILELTRRVAGYALVVIAVVFLAYVFLAPSLPGILNSPVITWQRFFSQIYTDAGILGPTTAVSSTYIILFIIFAAFLQASKVGDYFV
ncbi:MAG: TRAP transporter permease, partial [Hyphomicrobiaceae bacterium]|nr:TRAP transporter permease [Hyphomicrobiaceae bacterium]